MDARLRESFLRELMILQSPEPILSADPSLLKQSQQQQQQQGEQERETKQCQQPLATTTKQTSPPPPPPPPLITQAATTGQGGEEIIEPGPEVPPAKKIILEREEALGPAASRTTTPTAKASTSSDGSNYQHDKQRNRRVDITFFDESGSTGRTLSALFVACDTNLTHLLLNDLGTPIGIQPSALSFTRVISSSSTSSGSTSATTAAAAAATSVSATANDSTVAATGTAGANATANRTKRECPPRGKMSEEPFSPRRALVLRKFSRLEYERLCHPNLSEEQLAANLSQRGSIYDSLKHYDLVQKTCLQQIESTLASNDIEYQTVDKFGYTEEKINWADVIITSGGDGTFLMAASKVTMRDKPVIGINSDPTKSVGHLCLPSKYSSNFDKVIELLKAGKYQWQYKQRLRVTLMGEAADEEPKQLNDIRCDLRGYLDQDLDQDRCPQQKQQHQNTLNHHHHHQHNHLKANHDSQQASAGTSSTTTTTSNNLTVKTVDGKVLHKVRQLKERALNEVFVGETLSARVSYYELSVDNNMLMKMKSSGLTICTGTGSTSWYYNINKVTEQQILSILSIINRVTKQANKVDADDPRLIGEITKQFNETLTFAPTEPIMAYSIRDPIGYASALSHSHRGHAKRIEVKSRMQNACLVLDGCQFFPFNDGSYALIEVHDEDALKTVSIE